MQALDGNAIGGRLLELFATEMTTARGTCASCGATSMIAELRVYARAPGTVVRCPRCGNVVFVLLEVRGTPRIDLRAFRLLDPPARAPAL